MNGLNQDGERRLRPHHRPIQRIALHWFAARFQRPVRFTGTEGPVALLSDASACYKLMDLPTVGSRKLMEMVAAWVEAGGATLDKPTHFEVADGRF